MHLGSSTSPVQTCRLSTFWDQCSFSIGDTDFRWIDVTLAAMADGEWAAFERRLTEGLACTAHAIVEHRLPSASALEEAANAFRYERDLISGAEVTAWLESVGLDTDEWMAYVSRDVLRQTCAVEIEDVLDRFAPSSRQLESAVVSEGVCSGVFDTFARSFSERAALAFEQDDTVFRDRHPSASHAEAAVRLVCQHAHWLARRPESETTARLAAILGIDDTYRAACARLASEAALHGVVEANRLEWLVVDLESMSFATEDAAREAVLCVKADGLSLRDVGSVSRRPVERSQVFLADLPAERRDCFLAADTGCVVGPWARAGQFEIAVMVGRTAPALEHEAVAKRAHRALVQQAATRAARDHVRRPG